MTPAEQLKVSTNGVMPGADMTSHIGVKALTQENSKQTAMMALKNK